MDSLISAEIAEVKGLPKKEYFEKYWYRWEDVEKILRLNRKYKSMVNAQEDEHHLIAQARWGSNHKLNRKRMRRGDHVNLHDHFGIQTPAEQIEQVLDFNRKVFLPDIPNRIYEILDNAEWRRKLYKREVFK
jgi:hypothetical protein